jgi:excinuclease ABC subunit A
MGPEGGKQGGNLVASGTPEELLKFPESHTARFLKPYLTGNHLPEQTAR